jgi:hypothetical protein
VSRLQKLCRCRQWKGVELAGQHLPVKWCSLCQRHHDTCANRRPSNDTCKQCERGPSYDFIWRMGWRAAMNRIELLSIPKRLRRKLGELARKWSDD